ncbi:shikimate dehydrogenase [Micromonospora sp. ZYX-F-536]|uniref:shikimate dehydrogenase n=1 Tax=Micromonospora sp. ZYX-F-536 TaxID=3457629 RepID=UPI00404084A0
MTPHNGRGFLVGLIGAGIGTSLSPALHEQQADALGLRYSYRILDLDIMGVPATDVGGVLAAVRLAGFDGVNVTHPVKQLIIEHLDAVSPDAAAIGAVNTVLFTDGGAVGHNTDLPGFVQALSTGMPDVALDRVVVLGAGGAGAAVAHGLLSLGAGTVSVFDTDARRSDALARRLTRRFGERRAETGPISNLVDAIRDADGLTHTTPTGMEGHPGLPLPVELLRPGLWVADVVYRPLDTELIVAARALGCQVLDGGRMTAFQAAESFRLFTAVEPDAERMLRQFYELVHPPPGRRITHVRHQR